MSVEFGQIPNNVHLSDDKKLQRALLEWQPSFLSWWKEMGPSDFNADDIYLRTAVAVGSEGWAHFDYVKMPDYRWGIFLAPPAAQRTIGFGDNIGKPVWAEAPGELRKELRRIIVTQADTEPASVEQQRLLGHTAPSLYDLRNLFQVNVEEGRHLWAMVYLLHQFFGRDGREEAEELLARRSGHPDSPRILNAFNKPIEDWLAFFCFAMFTDRDGKYQLGALAESGFDPLARTTQFMLTEEAHHLFVGETGVGRVIAKTAQTRDPQRDGAIPFDIVQKYINEWFSASLDLFGSEDSSNAAAYFGAGLKGRFKESSSVRISDHVALEGSYALERPLNGAVVKEEIPLRRAMNLVLRDAYVDDCQRAVERWNGVLASAGHPARVALPSDRFNRQMGLYAKMTYTPAGELREGYTAASDLPSEADRAYVRSLMVKEYRPGKFASWIAPPAKGINAQPIDFAYARFAKEQA